MGAFVMETILQVSLSICLQKYNYTLQYIIDAEVPVNQSVKCTLLSQIYSYCHYLFRLLCLHRSKIAGRHAWAGKHSVVGLLRI